MKEKSEYGKLHKASCLKITENSFGANLAMAVGKVAAAAGGGACEFTNEFTSIADKANRTIDKFAILQSMNA